MPQSMPVRAREILSYFLHNPQAADSLEGVARWRLLEETVHRTVGEINEAIGWLVAHGFLLEESVAGSGPMFSLNHEQAAEAERILAGSRDPAGPNEGRKTGARPSTVSKGERGEH